MEEKVLKANNLNKKALQALEKVRARQRKLEMLSVKTYKQNI